MPEYLAPGVYVEETSFRSKSIEGVSTSTAAFVGPTRYGPIDGPPELVTSLAEFERIYGGIDELCFDDEADFSPNYLAHGVRAFFDNGGQRLYVTRIYREGAAGPIGRADGRAVATVTSPSGTLDFIARYPGRAGAAQLAFTFRVSNNALADAFDADDPTRTYPTLRGVVPYDLVWVRDIGSPVSSFPASGQLFWAEREFAEDLGRFNWILHGETGEVVDLRGFIRDEGDRVYPVTVSVEVTFTDRDGNLLRREAYERLTFDPSSRTSLSQVFAPELPTRTQQLTVPVVLDAADTMRGPTIARILLEQLIPPVSLDAVKSADRRSFVLVLKDGKDGVRPTAKEYEGSALDPLHKTGLQALEDVADISIVAAPGYTAGTNPDPLLQAQARQIANLLISHCERMRYRVAILDSADRQALGEVRALKAQLDSKHAALYYPWVRIMDPVTGKELNLPPSGFVAGICARNDVEKGVHKAPANEIVRDAIGFEFLLNKQQQDVLNPEGINCFRFFEGRGYRLWGARTISSDPEWKYLNVRRYFAYLERSIDVGTQWVVFENNGPLLWANVRRTIEDFLFNEWKSGHLFGEKIEEAYFVRCDQSTMTQNDLDNGRLVCLIGVAPLRPAEFVIFRIGQFTADHRS
jgi:phage tail sheath protein FI